ncbi:zinc carboxypeptidase [Mucilaginibacter sp. HMF5004]|uniref:M14 family metallopeptidase n=1 Tax=Mucilaginibacter rivuli TaxID=2857527 RepID=UPI001C5FAB4F|nr:M14 family metallopeptidase [Mucilaginibacter rivuli]MBW4888312.1 zinc carboxypeptidase [Mucilaginibacter rivuli]
MKKYLFLALFVCLFFNGFAQKLKSPSEFLGYDLGSQFTPHYRIVDYFLYLGQASKNIKVLPFGSTNENRPLFAAYIGTEANINNLEEIRKNNLRIAGLESGTANTNGPAIVWLSYNVHGNEPSSSEAAMQTAYILANPDNAEAKKWLVNTIVVIDPCLNPDGRDRYVNFYNPIHSAVPDDNPSSREHFEPWPGGRVNHYYFDLNRDWAWQTQKETQARLALYNHWLPQIHVDFHEQGYNNPYYFAPAAEPFHKVITQWQKDFQITIGKNNAKYFDLNNWMYFTKEEFDLLYPSYGDTYPLYNGAIGMTYEQGGIAAGLGIATRDGDTLTLGQRINHHITSGLSTVETASANAPKLLGEFKKFFSNSVNSPAGDFKGYVIKNDNTDKIETLAQLLDRNGIQYGFGGTANGPGFNYFTGATENFAIDAKDLVIDAHQPKSVLLSVLFEPKTFMTDSNTYDITAWALPYAYGLKTYGLKQSVKFQASAMPVTPEKPIATDHPYAYVSQWKSMADVRFLAALLKLNIKVRYAERPFTAAGKSFDAGSLIITHAGNTQTNFDQLIQQTALKFGRSLTALASGFVDKGADFGSAQIRYITRPRIMLVAGDGVSSGSVGEVWHLFEQQIGYPVTVVRLQDLNRIKWSDFDVAILPDGGYDNAPLEKIQAWIRDGGKLIAMENAVSSLIDKKGFNIKSKTTEKKDDKKTTTAKDLIPYEDRDREALKSSIPGAIYKLSLDNTHPLAYGLPKFYYSLKQGDDLYDYLGDGDWNVGTIKKDAYQAGFVGQKTKAKLSEGMLLGVQSSGRGSIIYMADDPLFRSFWENGKLLFSNAVFMVGK